MQQMEETFLAKNALEMELESFHLESAPKSTMLSAHELYLLEQAGYEVLQIVTGNVVYSMGLRGVIKTVKKAFGRGEMPDFTKMNNDARNLARNRMLEAAQEIGADMVVGVTFEDDQYADFLEIIVTGTAVRKVRVATQQTLPIAVGS